MSNPKRGCGTKKRGGYYLESGFSESGVLSPWTWVLGTHMFDAFENLSFGNLFTKLPTRGMTLVDIPASLATGNVVLSPRGRINMEPYQADLCSELEGKIGTVGLADMVGAVYYTPYSFAIETMVHGPSRRVPERFAKKIVEQLPLPILFAHRYMYLFPTVHSKEGAILSAVQSGVIEEPDSLSHAPTWANPMWGAGADDYHGDNHFMIPLLRHLTSWDKDRAIKQEMVFGLSWITKVSYVLRDENDTSTQDSPLIETMLLDEGETNDEEE